MEDCGIVNPRAHVYYACGIQADLALLNSFNDRYRAALPSLPMSTQLTSGTTLQCENDLLEEDEWLFIVA